MNFNRNSVKKSNIYLTILQYVNSDILEQPFNVSDVNKNCDGLLNKSPSFLSKHCVGNPGGYTEYFTKERDLNGIIKRGYYRINSMN